MDNINDAEGQIRINNVKYKNCRDESSLNGCQHANPGFRYTFGQKNIRRRGGGVKGLIERLPTFQNIID